MDLGSTLSSRATSILAPFWRLSALVARPRAWASAAALFASASCFLRAASSSWSPAAGLGFRCDGIRVKGLGV